MEFEFTHKVVSNKPNDLGKGFEVGTPVAVINRINFLGHQAVTITNGELVKMCIESQIEEIKGDFE